jgi:signal peptidase I
MTDEAEATGPSRPESSADTPDAGEGAEESANGDESADRRGGAHRAPAEGGGSVWTRYVARRRAKKAEKVRKPHRKAPWWELPALVVLAILIAILVKTFIVQPFYIPSASMEKTLLGHDGHHDRILVNKLIYDFRDPHPGDIVVFNAPPGWDDEPTSKPPSNPVLRGIRGLGQLIGFVPPDGQVLVKRVIAIGGQTVKGDARGNVFVSKNGPGGPFKTLDEPYVYESGSDPRAEFGPVTIPKGRLWVMGDHRNDSADSRYHCGPNATDSGGNPGDTGECQTFVKDATVPVDDVIGKAFVVAWPPSRWGTLGTPPTFTDLADPRVVPGAVGVLGVVPVVILRRRRRRPRRPRRPRAG